MIRNDEQLNQTREAIAHLEMAVASLKREVLPVNATRFAVMAEAAVDQIHELRTQVDEYVGITSALTQEAEVWLRIAGPEIEIGDAPTSVVTSLLDILRRGVQSVAEFLQRGTVGARPTALLKEACDLRIVGWLPGSVQVGLRLPEIPSEEGVASASEKAREALNLYLETASWVGSEADPAELERAIPDAEQRRLLLNQISQIVPRPRGAAEVVELSGRRIRRGPVRLQRVSRERVRTALQQTIREEMITARGLLREIDLDERSFHIRNREEPGTGTWCEIPRNADDLLAIAKEALDHPVEVSGTQRKDPIRRKTYPLQVREIEVLDYPIDESA